jgi:hypothetical protein
MRTRFLAVVLALGAASTMTASRAEDKVSSAEASIARMKKDAFYLAGPECNGRGVGSEGIEKAAAYVAEAFKDAGLRPGTRDGSYFQNFQISSGTRVDTAKLRFTGPGGQAIDLKPNLQFRPQGMTASGAAKGGIVFAGCGITLDTAARKYDDYAGLDVKDKIVIVMRRTPRADAKTDKFDTAENPTYPSIAAKVALATKNGAAAIIFVNDASYAKEGDEVMPFQFAGTTSTAKIPVVHMKRATLEHMLIAEQNLTLAQWEESVDGTLKPRSIAFQSDWTADLTSTLKRGGIDCKNVVGILDGSGPLAEETIVVGAHYDHLGTSSFGSLAGPSAEGKTHWGADDNGSGTTGLIEMARRLGAIKNREGRRIVFIAFSGEERGLLGSIHYCKEPVVPMEQTVFMLNMDMIGRVIPVEDGKGGKADRLLVYGTGTAEGFDTLVDKLNEGIGFKLTKLAAGSGPSDHDSFYRKKVPVLFFFTGTHREYHRPTDTPDKLNIEGMNKVLDYGERVMLHFATVKEKPKYTVTRERWVDPTEQRNPGAAASPRMSGPTLGIMPSYDESVKGVRLDGVSPGGPAEKAGLKDGDVIVEIAGKPVTDINVYMTLMNQQKPSVEIEVTVIRKGGKKEAIKITPQTRSKN